MKSDFKIIELFWMDLLREFERNESDEVLKILRFVENEVEKLHAITSIE
ncbi:hypothetical protein [Heyndrickxia shackletonii]|nr:hypothetical protein [Heyndrickxia shackletonii]NEY99221.1 hypothetical protein [Heyndrickxia shackletonii]